MSRARESAGSGAGRGTRSQVGDGTSALAELGRRFARFRLEHRRGARFPDDLREATLAALREVAPAAVYRTCGVSYGQVMAWKAARRVSRAAPARAQEAEPADVRVFSVIDEEPVHGLESTVSATGPELELRVGPWSVSVRLAGPGPAGRG